LRRRHLQPQPWHTQHLERYCEKEQNRIHHFVGSLSIQQQISWDWKQPKFQIDSKSSTTQCIPFWTKTLDPLTQSNPCPPDSRFRSRASTREQASSALLSRLLCPLGFEAPDLGLRILYHRLLGWNVLLGMKKGEVVIKWR
jgi:hypothetical protein